MTRSNRHNRKDTVCQVKDLVWIHLDPKVATCYVEDAFPSSVSVKLPTAYISSVRIIMLFVSLECRYKTCWSSNIKRLATIELAMNSGQILNHLSEYVTA